MICREVHRRVRVFNSTKKKKERDVETIPRSEKKNVVDIGACMVMQYIKVHLHPQTSENGGKTS